MTVYVTQEVLIRRNDGEYERKFDLSFAEKFGHVRILLQREKSMVSTVPVVRALKSMLSKFNEQDYLLLLGDPSIMAAASIIAANRNGGRLKILKWDRLMGDYIPVQLDTSGKAL